jgi:hypothetical protein
MGYSHSPDATPDMSEFDWWIGIPDQWVIDSLVDQSEVWIRLGTRFQPSMHLVLMNSRECGGVLEKR